MDDIILQHAACRQHHLIKMASPSDDARNTQERAGPDQVIRIKMLFTDRKTCTSFVQDLALSQGKRAVVDKQLSGGRNIVYRCSSKTPCSFIVRVLRSRDKNVHGFFVSSFVLEHHGCTGSASVTARQVTQLLSTRSAVAANQRIPARVLQAQVRASEAVAVPQRMAYRARDAIASELLGDYDVDFKKLPSLLCAFCAQNPTSHSSIDCDETGRFRRAFLSHPFVTRHQEFGQAVMGLDGAFMKHQVYKETMLVLVGRDGANHNITLAVALCDVEDKRNCSWFLDNCKTAGIKFDGVPLFSDRGKGIISAVSARAPGAVVRFCTRHIIGNIKHTFKQAPDDLEPVMYRAQAAVTKEGFESVLNTLRLTHPLIAAYIEEIDQERWTMHPDSVHFTKMYGWRTTNFVESTNGASIPARFKFPFQFFRHFMEQFMTHAYKSKCDGEKWVNDGRKITPYASDMVQTQREAAGFYNVLPSSSTTCFVQSTRGLAASYRVNVAETTCTCAYIRQYGLPCRHLIAALIKMKRLDTLFDACDKCYHVDSYIRGYAATEDSGVELVLDEVLQHHDVLPPIPTLTTSGRKKVKRIASQGEKPNSATTRPSGKCSLCGQTGHSTRNCTND
jgi:hypothetical protein